jgi:flagellar motor switch protein FliG
MAKVDHGTNPAAFHGLAAYQQTVNRKNAPEADDTHDTSKKTIATLFGGAFRKTPLPPEPLPKPPVEKAEPKEPESKFRRVAKLLIIIGREEASKILEHLEPAHVELIAKEIADIHGVTAEEAADVALEFRSLLSATFGYGASFEGGVDTARDILHTAFGKVKGEAILNRTLPESKGKPFAFLEERTTEELVMLFKDESPATAALVLSRLPAPQTAKVLSATPPDRKLDIVQRIAHLGKSSQEVLDRVSDALEEKAARIAANNTISIDGMNVLTDILKASDTSFGEHILASLGDKDPLLEQDLKERLHTLEEVVKAQDRPLQEKLSSMADKEIVLLLKNRSREFTEKILFNVSAQRRILIREEATILGPVLKKEAEAAAHDFLDWFTTEREAGNIILNDDEDLII